MKEHSLGMIKRKGGSLYILNDVDRARVPDMRIQSVKEYCDPALEMTTHASTQNRPLDVYDSDRHTISTTYKSTRSQCNERSLGLGWCSCCQGCVPLGMAWETSGQSNK